MRRPASVIIELLSLLFVVGLVAVVAIPDNDTKKPDNRRELISSLERVRTALHRYWGDHDAQFPAIDDLSALIDNQRSSRPSSMAAYLSKVPENPFTGGSTIGNLSDPIGSTDWVYEPEAGIFKANNSMEHRAL